MTNDKKEEIQLILRKYNKQHAVNLALVPSWHNTVIKKIPGTIIIPYFADSSPNDKTSILFPFTFKFKYILHDDVIKEIIDKRLTNKNFGAYLNIAIRPQGSIYGITVLDRKFRRFHHYHSSIGRDYDCLGEVSSTFKISSSTISINKLKDFITKMTAALEIINENSIFNSSPPDLPSLNSISTVVKNNSTKTATWGR